MVETAWGVWVAVVEEEVACLEMAVGGGMEAPPPTITTAEDEIQMCVGAPTIAAKEVSWAIAVGA